MDTSEFLVALAASVGFLIGLGTAVLDPLTIGGLLLGGVLAAPLAAWLVTKIPAPVLGTGVGGIIVLTNTRTILKALEITGGARTAIYAVIVVAWIAAVALAVTKVRQTARYRGRRGGAGSRRRDRLRRSPAGCVCDYPVCRPGWTDGLGARRRHWASHPPNARAPSSSVIARRGPCVRVDPPPLPGTQAP